MKTETVIDSKGDIWEFRVENGQHWWKHLDGDNHKQIGGSTEGYFNRQEMISNAKRNGFVPPET
jgi:hypothetical protein